MLTREELLATFLEILAELTEEAGGEALGELTEDARPADLPQFDSLRCLEFEVLLSERLHVEIEDVVLMPDGGTARSLAEIATAVLGIMEETPLAAAEGSDEV